MAPETKPQRVPLRLDCDLRLCREADLPLLEWFGAFTAHRQIIAEAFAMQAGGAGLMFVAAINDFPVGQVWLRFMPESSSGRLWALRVMQPFQGAGLGSRLVRLAEEVLIERGFGFAEIGVDKANAAVRRLYEKLGYASAGELVEEFAYVTPGGERRQEIADQWLLKKRLTPAA